MKTQARQIHWGVIGASSQIARICVIPAIKRSGNGELYGLSSRSPERARTMAKEFSVPHVYDDYQALLDEPEIDAVYIPLPNHLHCEWTLRALQAGKHVLCEKPLAMNASEARRMILASQSAGLLIMEAFMYRFHPRSLKLKQIVEQGAIGEPRLIRVSFCFQHDNPEDYRLKPEMGGGALMDVGCYGIHLARWLFAAEPHTAQGLAIYGPSGVDLTTIGLLSFSEDRVAIVEASFQTALQQTYSIIGTGGAIELPHNAFIPWENEAGYIIRGVDDDAGELERLPGADEYQIMVEHFADAVLGSVQLSPLPEDSIRNMQVLDALAEATRFGKPVRLRD